MDAASPGSAVELHAAFPAKLLLSAIVDSSDDAIISKSLDGTIASWNRGAERMFGYSSAEVLGRPITLLLPPELRDEEREIMQRVAGGERIEHYESLRRRKDGSTLDVSLTVSPIRAETGEVIGASNVLRDITRRKRALDATHLLAAIVESSDDAIVSKNLDGIITSWNRGAQRVFGYTAEEMIGQPVLKLIPAELQYEEATILSRLRRGERIEHYESIRQRKDGTRIHVSLTISPIFNSRGEAIGASKVARDVTPQRRAAETANLLAAIVESSDDAIVSKNLQGIITSWNRGAERVFGYPAAEIVGQSVLTLIPPELQHEEPRILAQLARGERIEHYESIRQRKDGTRINVSLTISPIRDAEGRVIGASKVARDITRQRRADDAVRLLAAIVNSSDDAIVSKNLQGIVTSWNRGAERIFGFTAEEMIGQSILKIFPPERVDEETTILERLRRGESVDHFQTVRRRKNGEHVHVSITISPMRNAAGEIVGASKVARDITREQLVVSQLEHANNELKRADRMKSEFLAFMSHELRTPLNSIIGFAAVLGQGRSGPVTQEQKNQLGLIHGSGKHLLGLINDLLDLSRIEAGRAEIDPESFALDEVIQEAVRTLEIQAAQKKLRVRACVDVAEPVFTDRKRVYQVVLNLLNNAIKFTAQGSVDVRARQQGGDVLVSVADTGIGIPREKQPQLFQPFMQLEGSARRRYDGTGLGLYLSKRIVTLLGGDISVESDSNRGAVFTFRVPARYTAPASNVAPVEPASP